MISIEPLRNMVIIRKEEPKEATDSGIILTGSSRKTPAWAEVVAVGPGTEDEPMLLRPYDKVIYPTTGGTPIAVDDVDYVIFKQEDILAIVKGVDE